MRLLCVEQDVGKLNNIHFPEFWGSCAQNKTSQISKMHFQDFWDSCAQNKTSEISQIARSRILGLLCAEQHVGNLKCTLRNPGIPVRRQTLTFRNPGTPVRRTERRKSQKHALSGIQATKTNSAGWGRRTFLCGIRPLGTTL